MTRKSMLVMLSTVTVSTHAATITIINTADSGAGSLRSALASANSGDTINFSLTLPATITLTNGQLDISRSVDVLGPGAGSLAINGDASNRVFHIAPGKTVTIAG